MVIIPGKAGVSAAALDRITCLAHWLEGLQRMGCVLCPTCLMQDPDGFVADSEIEQEALRQRLNNAQEALPDIGIDREVRSAS